MASITVEIVSKSSSEAGTVFVLAASQEEIASAGFVPYFIDQRFAGLQHPTTPGSLAAVTPYGSVVMAPQVTEFYVYVLPFVPALTNGDIDSAWVLAHRWMAYKLVKTTDKPNGTYQPNPLTPTMNVGDTLVYYDSKPTDPA